MALRCQVKICTRRSLHLRIANHTARDVYVRLVGQGGCIAGTSVGLERHLLEPSKEGILEPRSRLKEDDNGPLTISELVYSPCASMLPTPVEDSQGGVDLLFSSPMQSPARLLRELHADPDIQAQLEADRERDRAYELLALLSSNERVRSCVWSVARLVAVVMGVLLVSVPALLLLLEVYKKTSKKYIY
uniref:Uncharacterized protein n=1 Tax=Neogobius melanostomus TaxID=47308 RepID=A0A8C6WM76_9GOBI